MGGNSGSREPSPTVSAASGFDPGRAELDMADAAAEYFNIYINDWPREQRAGAGRYLLKMAALLTLGD